MRRAIMVLAMGLVMASCASPTRPARDLLEAAKAGRDTSTFFAQGDAAVKLDVASYRILDTEKLSAFHARLHRVEGAAIEAAARQMESSSHEAAEGLRQSAQAALQDAKEAETGGDSSDELAVKVETRDHAGQAHALTIGIAHGKVTEVVDESAFVAQRTAEVLQSARGSVSAPNYAPGARPEEGFISDSLRGDAAQVSEDNRLAQEKSIQAQMKAEQDAYDRLRADYNQAHSTAEALGSGQDAKFGEKLNQYDRDVAAADEAYEARMRELREQLERVRSGR